MSNWFVDHRIAWIVESVSIFGSIKRKHIMAKFRVSMPQAAADIKETMRRHPGLMEYNSSAKQYVARAEGCGNG
jgi:hypothetical protein